MVRVQESENRFLTENGVQRNLHKKVTFWWSQTKFQKMKISNKREQIYGD